MTNARLRTLSLSAGVACFGALAASTLGTSANTTARISSGPAQRSNAGRPVQRAFRRRDTTQGCSGSGSGSFLGGDPSANRAGGSDSAVLGGGFNEACDDASGIAVGGFNIVGNGNGDASDSFIGGGNLNLVTGEFASIGAGYDNTVSGNGSFIGAGDSIYNASGKSGAGSAVSGQDSFIGAGDQNSVAGQTAFDGAGQGNTISDFGADSAIVAGGLNTISYENAFIGSGAQNFAGEYDFVGGGSRNSVTGVDSAIVTGGYYDGGNSISGDDSFIGSGEENVVSGSQSVLAGGVKNSVSATEASVVGGFDNVIGSSGSFSIIAGGNANSVTNEYGVVGGGYDNAASGADAVIPGGQRNVARGELSFAAGYQAHALYTGSFVWSDYTSGSSALADTAADQFVVRASGGTYVYSSENDTTGVKLAAGSGTWSSLSDRNAKTAVVPLDDASILAKVAALPVSAWQYKTERGVRHVGPMAQDFYAAFGVGEDDRHITSIDEDGVALAAIKALHFENGRLQRENESVLARLAALEAENVELERRLDAVAPRR